MLSSHSVPNLARPRFPDRDAFFKGFELPLATTGQTGFAVFLSHLPWLTSVQDPGEVTGQFPSARAQGKHHDFAALKRIFTHFPPCVRLSFFLG